MSFFAMFPKPTTTACLRPYQGLGSTTIKLKECPPAALAISETRPELRPFPVTPSEKFDRCQAAALNLARVARRLAGWALRALGGPALWKTSHFGKYN